MIEQPDGTKPRDAWSDPRTTPPGPTIPEVVALHSIDRPAQAVPLQRPVDWDTWLLGATDVELLDLASQLEDDRYAALMAVDVATKVRAIESMRGWLTELLRRIETRTTEGLRR